MNTDQILEILMLAKHIFIHAFEMFFLVAGLFLTNLILAVCLIAISIVRGFWIRMIGGILSLVWSGLCFWVLGGHENIFQYPDGDLILAITAIISIFAAAFTGSFCARNPS
ncbi:MAG: hypothetical protein AAB438_03550 [Patescibacteria group bacterium]